MDTSKNFMNIVVVDLNVSVLENGEIHNDEDFSLHIVVYGS